MRQQADSLAHVQRVLVLHLVRPLQLLLLIIVQVFRAVKKVREYIELGSICIRVFICWTIINPLSISTHQTSPLALTVKTEVNHFPIVRLLVEGGHRFLIKNFSPSLAICLCRSPVDQQ